jgi:amidase
LYLFRDAFYTALWNGLDYSACTFPVTFVDPVLDAPVPRTEFYNKDDEHVYRWCEYDSFLSKLLGVTALDFFPISFYNAPRYPWLTRSSSDNPHVVKGSPVGLQLVGRTHEEEAVLTMTSIVADALAAARRQ